MTTNAHVDELIEMFALGALTDSERTGVERHLSTCVRCRQLAADAAAVASALPIAIEPVGPSPQVKRKLMARIDADLAAGSTIRTARTPRPAAPYPGWLATLLRGWSPAAMSVAVLLLVLVGSWVLLLQNELAQARAELALLSRPDLRMINLPQASGAPATAQARLFSSPSQATAILTVTGLRSLGPDQTYEFWLIRGSQTLPAGVFNVDVNGTGRLLVRSDEPVGNFQQAGITIERAGGSATPNLNALVFAGPIN